MNNKVTILLNDHCIIYIPNCSKLYEVNFFQDITLSNFVHRKIIV